jgi:hypothetical protein
MGIRERCGYRVGGKLGSEDEGVNDGSLLGTLEGTELDGSDVGVKEGSMVG